MRLTQTSPDVRAGLLSGRCGGPATLRVTRPSRKGFEPVTRRILPLIGLATILVAAGVGFGVWFALGGDGGCDRDALREAIRQGVEAADRRGLDEVYSEPVSGCGEEDLRQTLHDVTHEWHVMPGGSLMRGASHGD